MIVLAIGAVFIGFEDWQHVGGRTIKRRINSTRPAFNGFYTLQSYSFGDPCAGNGVYYSPGIRDMNI